LVSAAGCAAGFNYGAGAATGKPFIVAPNFQPTDADICPLQNDSQARGRCVLFINNYSESQVAADPVKKIAPGGKMFGIEVLRDFIMCGYYTHNPKAPSYFQRLLEDSYSRNDTQLGIETFVIGNYANDYNVYDTRSRLDRELFNTSIDGVKVRGLPGCRDFNSCADFPMTGVFALGKDTRDDYGLGQIACDDHSAGCSQ
jgi:hypothetical protein